MRVRVEEEAASRSLVDLSVKRFIAAWLYSLIIRLHQTFKQACRGIKYCPLARFCKQVIVQTTVAPSSNAQACGVDLVSISRKYSANVLKYFGVGGDAIVFSVDEHNAESN